MHPRIAELIDYAQLQRAEILRAVSLIPEPWRDCRVSPEAWSAAEVLEHLHRVESKIARLFASAIARAKAAGVEPERENGSVMNSLDSFELLDRGGRIPAPEPVRPRGAVTASQAIAALVESRHALLSALTAGDGLALGTITQPHPLLGPLNLYQWVLFVGQHEARHAGQIRELARQLVTPGSAT